MAQSKPKPIEDVAVNAPADPTARPVIIKQRPVLTDPVVVRTDTEDDGRLSPHISQAVKIEPLSDEAELKAQADKAPQMPTKPEPKTEVTAPKPDEPSAEPDQTDAPPETNAPAPSHSTDSTEPVESEIKTPEQAAAEAKRQAAAEASAAAHAAEIEQLIKEQKYALPINMKEQRRDRKVLIIGGLIAILLALAWLDVALDAGIISNSYHLPHTHFFTNKS